MVRTIFRVEMFLQMHKRKFFLRANSPMVLLSALKSYLIYYAIPICLLSCEFKGSEMRANRLIALKSTNTNLMMPDSVSKFIQAALDTMRKYSIFTDSIDWSEMRRISVADARGAQIYSQTYYALDQALIRLDDHHSFLKTPSEVRQWLGAGEGAYPYQKPHGKMKDDRIAWISVPTFSSGDSLLCLQFASELQSVIKQFDKKNPVGWLVNLEFNRGGNMWPMLVGLGPLFAKEGKMGGFLSASGECTMWSYANGVAMAGSEVMLTIPHPYKVSNLARPIAVMVSDRTASSAEAVLISLGCQENVKTFGIPTAGLSTANAEFFLKDSTSLVITTALMTDVECRPFGGKIIPQVNLEKNFLYNVGYRQQKPLEWIREKTINSSKAKF